jgi:hypothetical protein
MAARGLGFLMRHVMPALTALAALEPALHAL